MTEDEEKTWRALKGESPVAPFRCRVLHLHRWTAWKRNDTIDGASQWHVRMWRYCADCNDVDSKVRTFKKG